MSSSYRQTYLDEYAVWKLTVFVTTEYICKQTLGNSVIIIKWNLPDIFVDINNHIREKMQTVVLF